MKRALFTVLIISLVLIGCKTTKPLVSNTPVPVKPPEPVVQIPAPPVNFSSPETYVLGYFKTDRLYQEPHSSWFLKGFDNYQPDQEVIAKLTAINMKDISIKIVMGSWCPDSRREVPRFMRILKEIKFPSAQVQLIGVDNSKIAPIDNYASLKIERVPTFIFFKNNNEAGRIIENPVTSLEQDMNNILTRNEKQ